MPGLTEGALAQARSYYGERTARFPTGVLERLRVALDVGLGALDDALIDAVARFQRGAGLVVDGQAGAETMTRLLGHDLRARVDPLPGSLDPAAITDGKPRERFGLRQRRAWPRVFGEPRFEVELVPAAIEPTRPHVVAYDAWRRMVGQAEADGVDGARLQLHSAYRSVAFQREIFAYRLAERREQRRAAGEPELPERELQRIQRKWTAAPGTSAHHTGLALDLKLYELGKRGAKRAPEYAWLARNAARFGFYPYLPEGWHWEYNPPGLVEQLGALRQAIAAGAPFEHLLHASPVIDVP